MKKFVLLSLLLFTIRITYAETDRIYSTRDGLSGTYFHEIYHDSKGYLWVCTNSGLNRFDGYNFSVYQYDANDSNSINSSIVSTVFEDSKGRIWVGTNIGLNVYVPEKNCFKRIKIRYNGSPFNVSVKKILQDIAGNLYLITSNGLIHYEIQTEKHDIFNIKFDTNGFPGYTQFNYGIFDKQKNIWIATTNDKIIVFNTTKKIFHEVGNYTGKPVNLPDINYMVLYMTSKNQIIASGQKGDVYIFDRNENSFNTIKLRTENDTYLSGGVTSFCTDNKNVTWLGTEYSGLKILDLNKKTIKDANDQLDVENLNRSKVLCYIDKNGDLWFAVNYLGLIHKLKPLQKFNSVSALKFNLSNHLVKAITKDKDGNIWVGTDGGGINLLSGKDYRGLTVPRLNSFAGKAVISLFTDSRGWIWVGTYLDGLYCYKPGSGFEKIALEIENSALSLNNIFDIKEDENGNMWFATNGSGLVFRDVKASKTIAFGTVESTKGKMSIPQYINDLVLDKKGTIWMATYYGIYSWNYKTREFVDFNQIYRILINEICYDMERVSDNILVLAGFSGLYTINLKLNTIEKFSLQNGLPSNTIVSVKAENSENVWVSTSYGISRFNLASKTFRNYFSYDGLPCNEYLTHSSYVDSDSNIYFGGVNGFVQYNPYDIVARREKPQLVITNFTILNKSQHNHSDSNYVKIIESEYNEALPVTLKYADRSFSFEFAAINFTAPEKIKYAVMMEGFENNWNLKDYKQRYASYTNLNPGTYILRIKSTNTDGEWIEPGRKITLVILPPFWFAWWAIVIYALVLAIIFYYLRAIFLFRIKLKNKLHLEQIEHQRQESISQAKLQFFTNVSHEIRTPLSMVLAPLQKLMDSGLTEEQQKYTGFIERNTRRLARIVNQLLELQKIENQQLEFYPRYLNIVKFIGDVLSLFEGSVLERQVELLFEPSDKVLMVWFDEDKLDKIIFNLVSNALKFTPKGGIIVVSVKLKSEKNQKTKTEWCEIKISDSGSGIKKEELGKIFERFYQADNQSAEVNAGTGIGLHLVKSFVEIHKGKIHADSEPGLGTSITIYLPLNIDYSKISTPVMRKSKPAKGIFDTEDYEVNEQSESLGNYKPAVLIIEDDTDLLDFLRNEMEANYQVISATNGDRGWKLACKYLPNLIISDISMPGISGIDLCNKLKSNFETSHIPVILLTARTALEHEIQGIETGADEYIHKPFNISLLKLKVEKLIETREYLKQKFSKGVNFTAKEMTVTSSDEKFLQKAMNYVKDNLSDPDFSIEKMCVDIGVSRVHLYRKIKSLTNQVPSEFIRIIRLKQAAYLLEQGKLNISEIAFKVGFNSHQYFTNSFQNYFNMSPKEYAATKNATNTGKE